MKKSTHLTLEDVKNYPWNTSNWAKFKPGMTFREMMVELVRANDTAKFADIAKTQATTKRVIPTQS